MFTKGINDYENQCKKNIFLLLATAMTMLMYGCGEGEKIDTGLQVQDRPEEGDVLSESTGIDEIYYVYDSISGEYGLYDRATQEYVIEPEYMSIGLFLNRVWRQCIRMDIMVT